MASRVKVEKTIATGMLMVDAHHGYAPKPNPFRGKLGIGIVGRIAR
jgi:hypothetical protein